MKNYDVILIYFVIFCKKAAKIEFLMKCLKIKQLLSTADDSSSVFRMTNTNFNKWVFWTLKKQYHPVNKEQLDSFILIRNFTQYITCEFEFCLM